MHTKTTHWNHTARKCIVTSWTTPKGTETQQKTNAPPEYQGCRCTQRTMEADQKTKLYSNTSESTTIFSQNTIQSRKVTTRSRCKQKTKFPKRDLSSMWSKNLNTYTRNLLNLQFLLRLPILSSICFQTFKDSKNSNKFAASINSIQYTADKT